MIALALGTAYLGLLAGKAVLALRAAARCPQPGAAAHGNPRVVIAQPILSGDPHLRTVLEDNVRALPWAHFVWLVDADDAVASDICEALRHAHPAVRIDVLVSPPPPDGVNPKLFKLERARSIAGEDVLLVLDDDTRMPPASLGALLAGLEESDIATGLPAYVDDGHWPSRLLAQFVNNNAALTYLPLLNVWPPPTINGMAYAMRGATLARLGGFEPLVAHLTDDLAVARMVIAAGGRIAQTAHPQWVQTTVDDGGHYVRLMHRWFLFAHLLLKRQALHMQLVIALLHGLPSVLLWGVAVSALVAAGASGALVLATVLVSRAFILMALQRRVYGRSLHRPLLSLVSELLQPCHMAHAALVHTIVWRTRRYDVHADQSFRSVS